MKFYLIFYFAVLFSINLSVAQNNSIADTLKQNEPILSNSPYKLYPAVDVPITTVGAGLSIYGFYLISEKPGTSEEKVQGLSRDNVNGFDRSATNQFSSTANNTSDYFMYGALPIPFLVTLLDNDMRKDFWKISFLFLEAMSIDGTIYGMTAGGIDRYRPLVYNEMVPMEERTRGYAKSSFIGGHPSVTATAGFFIAKVYADYHPESDVKYVLYGLAAAATTGNAILRYKAGKHFPSDLIAGVAVGTLTGILVPHFHKKERKNSFTFMPFTGDVHGLSMTYKFK